jgi:hypothetical protein
MRLTAILLGLLLSVTSCAPRVYWPQGHYHRAALPPAPTNPAARAAYIRRLDSLAAVLWSGTARLQRWSPAPVKCQQRAFFSLHRIKK